MRFAIIILLIALVGLGYKLYNNEEFRAKLPWAEKQEETTSTASTTTRTQPKAPVPSAPTVTFPSQLNHQQDGKSVLVNGAYEFIFSNLGKQNLNIRVIGLGKPISGHASFAPFASYALSARPMKNATEKFRNKFLPGANPGFPFTVHVLTGAGSAISDQYAEDMLLPGKCVNIDGSMLRLDVPEGEDVDPIKFTSDGSNFSPYRLFTLGALKEIPCN